MTLLLLLPKAATQSPGVKDEPSVTLCSHPLYSRYYKYRRYLKTLGLSLKICTEDRGILANDENLLFCYFAQKLSMHCDPTRLAGQPPCSSISEYPISRVGSGRRNTRRVCGYCGLGPTRAHPYGRHLRVCLTYRHIMLLHLLHCTSAHFLRMERTLMRATFWSSGRFCTFTECSSLLIPITTPVWYWTLGLPGPHANLVFLLHDASFSTPRVLLQGRL